MGYSTRLLVLLLAWGLLLTEAMQTKKTSIQECGEWMTTPRTDAKNPWKATQCTKRIFVEAENAEAARRICEGQFPFGVKEAKREKASVECTFQLDLVCNPDEFPLYDMCLSTRPESTYAEIKKDCQVPTVFGKEHLKFLTRILEIRKIDFAFISPTSFRNIPPMFKTPKATFRDAKDGEMLLWDSTGLVKAKGGLDAHGMFVVRRGYDPRYGLRRGGTEPVSKDFRATSICVRNGRFVSDNKTEAENWGKYYPMIHDGERTLATSSRIYAAGFDNVHKLNEFCFNIWKSFMDGVWTPQSTKDASKLSIGLTTYPARLALKRRGAGKQAAASTCGGKQLADEKKFYMYTDRNNSLLTLKLDEKFWSNVDPQNECSDGEEGASTAGISANRIVSMPALQRSPIMCQHGSTVKVGAMEETCANALCDATHGICDDSSGKPVCKCKNNYQPSKALQTETLLPEGYICSPCPKIQADIVILVDHSRSVEAHNAIKQNEFIETFVNSFTISREQTRIAIVKFSTVDATEFVMRFEDCEDPKTAQKCIKDKIAAKPYGMGGRGTCHDAGYQLALEEIKAHGDMKKNRAVIMITDGAYDCWQSSKGDARVPKEEEIPKIMKEIRNAAPNLKTSFYVIKINAKLNDDWKAAAKETLPVMAENKTENLMQVNDFSQLSASLITELQRVVCG